MARKRPAGGAAAGARKPKAKAGKAKAAKAKPKAKPKAAKPKPVALRTMDALGDAERVAVFEAVAKTLRAHGVADALISLHFARNEFDLMCPDGKRVMRCQLEGPTVVCEPVCEPK